MSDHSELLPPPNSPAEFELLCLDLWRDMWGDPNAQLWGRSGQEQHGIDLSGKVDGKRIGLQCKQKSARAFKKLTAAVLMAEVEKAKGFPEPGLDSFVLATTAPRDKNIQLKALDLSKQYGFEVTVWSWDDIWHELDLTLGDVPAAVDDAEQSVVFADRSGDEARRMITRTTLADARHQAGDEATALLLFREAERLQVEWRSSYPLLSSLQGFRHCDLLLAPAALAAGSGKGDRAAGKEACAEVERRATQTILIAEKNNWLLNIALDHLSLGRVRLYQAILDDRASQAAAVAQTDIEKAVAGLRAAGSADHIPRGLLTRAWLRFVTADEDGARADLDEAQEIAERGSMRLHLADVTLYRARFFGDREALVTARRLVDECGYGRRRAELAILEERLLGSLPQV